MKFGPSEEQMKKIIPWREQIKLLKIFLSYYPKHKKLLILDLIMVILAPALSTLNPMIVYRVLQDALPAKNLRMILAGLSGLLILTALNILSVYVRTKWGHVLGIRMETDMRRDLFAHVQKMSFSYFDRTKTGNLMSRISNDLTAIAEMAHHCPEDVISATLLFAGGLTVMLFINPMLTLLTLIPLPFAVFWGIHVEPAMRQCFGQSRKDIAAMNSQVENSIQGIREVKSYTREKWEITKFRGINNQYRKTKEGTFSILAKFHSGMMFLIHGWSMIFLGIASILVYFGKANIPEVVTFLMYSNQITMPIMRLVGFVEQYLGGMAAFQRFQEVMVQNPEICDKPDSIRSLPGRIRGDVSLKDVCFHYDCTDNAPMVLNHVSLEIPPGKTVALVGESGAGKTTLASLLPRFYEVCSGSISIDGIDVRDFSQEFLRNNIGIVQQTPFLFDTTIRNNILLGNLQATEAQIRDAAQKANILSFIDSLPEGFNSLCGENGVRLSGGQKQRISLARLFLKNPAILIFDEATSALDNESEGWVKEAMESIAKERTTLVIAHRLSTIKNADWICCMKQGKIVEKGTHEELLAKNGYYKRLYSMHTF